jgi:hypothetical protein
MAALPSLPVVWARARLEQASEARRGYFMIVAGGFKAQAGLCRGVRAMSVMIRPGRDGEQRAYYARS